MMNKITIRLVWLIAVFSQIIYGQAESVDNFILSSKFQLGLGMYIPTQKVKFSIDAESQDQLIEFDESFDFNNNKSTPDIRFDWSFAKKWKLGVEFFKAGYTNKKVLEKDITAGDYTFEAGSNVSLGYNLDLYRIYVGRKFLTGLKHEFGGSLGVHVLNVKPFIKGNVIVNENDNEFKVVTATATAPLPNIGIWYGYVPTDKWAITARVDWFGLSVKQYSGSLWDVSPGIRYQIIKNLGLAVDYRFFKVNAGVNEDQWEGDVDLSFSGPTISLIGSL